MRTRGRVGALIALVAVAVGCGNSVRVAPRVGALAWDLSVPTPSGAPAPTSVQSSLVSVSAEGAPSWLAPQLDGMQARRVLTLATSRGTDSVWYAPTARGGWCLTLQAPRGQEPFDGSCTQPGRVPPLEASYAGGFPDGPQGRAPFIVFGHASPPATTVDVVGAGAVKSIPTSIPLRQGFFAIQVLLRARNWPAALVVRDASGVELARRPLVWKGYWAFLTVHASLAALSAGSSTCTSAPLTAPPIPGQSASVGLIFGGDCSRSGRLSGTLDGIFQGLVLFEGTVPRGVERARLRFADGATQAVPLQHGVALALFRQAQLRGRHRPVELQALNAAGAVIGRAPVTLAWQGFSTDDQ
jgi:hypothetical protein